MINKQNSPIIATERNKLVLCVLIIILFFFCGCRQNHDNESLFVYDWGETAKEYALSLFDTRIAEDNPHEYEIEKVFYGFNVSDDAQTSFVVVLHYSVDEDSGNKYGYIISVDQLGNCTLLEEGSDVAKLLFDPTAN